MTDFLHLPTSGRYGLSALPMPDDSSDGVSSPLPWDPPFSTISHPVPNAVWNAYDDLEDLGPEVFELNDDDVGQATTPAVMHKGGEEVLDRGGKEVLHVEDEDEEEDAGQSFIVEYPSGVALVHIASEDENQGDDSYSRMTSPTPSEVSASHPENSDSVQDYEDGMSEGDEGSAALRYQEEDDEADEGETEDDEEDEGEPQYDNEDADEELEGEIQCHHEDADEEIEDDNEYEDEEAEEDQHEDEPSTSSQDIVTPVRPHEDVVEIAQSGSDDDELPMTSSLIELLEMKRVRWRALQSGTKRRREEIEDDLPQPIAEAPTPHHSTPTADAPSPKDATDSNAGKEEMSPAKRRRITRLLPSAGSIQAFTIGTVVGGVAVIGALYKYGEA